MSGLPLLDLLRIVQTAASLVVEPIILKLKDLVLVRFFDR